MASLKALKLRIGSVKSTQKITKAMKTVAAAKLRRAQEAAVAGRPYAERLEAVMASLAGKVTISESSPRLLAGTGRSDVHLIVVVGIGWLVLSIMAAVAANRGEDYRYPVNLRLIK